jgi:hypothetical protein
VQYLEIWTREIGNEYYQFMHIYIYSYVATIPEGSAPGTPLLFTDPWLPRVRDNDLVITLFFNFYLNILLVIRVIGCVYFVTILLCSLVLISEIKPPYYRAQKTCTRFLLSILNNAVSENRCPSPFVPETYDWLCSYVRKRGTQIA